MFTGIIESVGKVVSFRPAGGNAANAPNVRSLAVDTGGLTDGLQPGASVAINGVCLTLVTQSSGVAAFDVVVETLKCSNLTGLRPGDGVNLERSLSPSDRIDGHFVQGHIDALGRVHLIERGGGEWKLWIAADADAMRYVISKGSIALDGVSLTVVDVCDDRFSVVLIPTTLERTTLGKRREGDTLNIETDIIARTIVARLEALGLAPSQSTLRDQLSDAGFLS